MKLTKRQLKKIIREEKQRLVRQGLIIENNYMAMGAPYDTDLFANFCDCVDSLYDDDPSWVTNTLGYLWEEDIEEMTADEDGYGDDSNQHLVAKFQELGGAYEVCPYLIELSTQNGKGNRSHTFLMNKFLKFAAEEKQYVVEEW